MTTPVENVLGRLKGVRPEKRGQWQAQCPAHPDENPSLSIGTGDDGRVLLHCQAGCTVDAVLSAAQLTSADLFANGGNGNGHTGGNVPKRAPQIIATYDYADAQGELLFQTVRFDPKDFRQRRPDGHGAWIWNLRDTPRVLYRLRDIIDSDAETWVCICEGEKDCDALHALGLVATTNPTGAGKWSKLTDDKALDGRRVVILPDKDTPGRAHADDVASRLHGRVRDLRIVELPGPGKDVSDWIDAGGTTAELIQLIDAAPIYQVDVVAIPAPAEFNLTDLGNAERLVHEHGHELRYTDSHGWLVWTGTHWQRDTTGQVERLAADTVRAIYAAPVKIEDPDQRKRLATWAISCESKTRLANMVSLATSRSVVRIAADILDADPWLLNVENGTIDLHTGELRQHDPADLITHCCPVVYDPAAVAPVFLEFLERIMGGDADLIGFLQRAIGYCLTGDVAQRVGFVLYGTGCNGKSTFLNVFRDLLGTYAQQTPTRTLMSKGHDGIPNDVARLRGARFVTAIETTEGQRLDVGLFKAMTGGTDVLAARFMRQEYFEFRPEFKLWLACNHKPDVRDTTDSIWDRIRLVPFEVRIPENKIDQRLPEKLVAERPGILNWALRGLLSWQAGGLDAPKRVRDATSDYRQESDLIGQWITECCETTGGARETLKRLYESYSQWTSRERLGARDILTKNKLGRLLSERGFTPDRAGSGDRVYVGLAVRTMFDSQATE